MSDDPYRTPGVVETREQRIGRLKRNYENMAIEGQPRDPVERAEALMRLIKAKEAYLRALTSK